jgi:hypothetical protein
MPVIMDKIKVFIDFHIYAILEFDILIGYPLENLIKEKPFYRSLSKEFRKIASATHLEIPMVEHHPNNELFEEVKFISPFVLLEFSCEMEHSSPPSLKPKSYPSSCNTPGVCHQLSNGFELKHDMSSGNEGVKIKST